MVTGNYTKLKFVFYLLLHNSLDRVLERNCKYKFKDKKQQYKISDCKRRVYLFFF